VLDALLATTIHVVADAAVKLFPLIEHPVPLTVKLNAPVPKPPVVVRSTEAPVEFVKTVFEIVKVGWKVHDLNPCQGPKVKLLGLDRVDKNPSLEAFTAVTSQSVSTLEVNTLPVILQRALLVSNETVPVPEPPVVARDIDAP
jgi:hypothetical protein